MSSGAAGSGDRRVTWTELFFDLVSVVAVGRTNQILLDDQSRSAVLWFGVWRCA